MSLSPRWLDRLSAILDEHKQSTAYALATVDNDSKGVPISRVRHHLHRDILRAHPVRPLLITTSHVDAPKVHQIHAHPSNDSPTSEVAWWIEPAMVQFRIGARIHILPASTHKLHAEFPLGLVSDRGASPNAPKTTQDWEEIRIKMFNKLEPHTRAGFARPISGTPPGDAGKWPKTLPEAGKEKTEEERRFMRQALENFAVLLLEPLRVELLDLSGSPAQSTHWSFDGHKWTEKTVIP